MKIFWASQIIHFISLHFLFILTLMLRSYDISYHLHFVLSGASLSAIMPSTMRGTQPELLQTVQ